MLYKHEIPILEFDTDREAVIMPTHEHLDVTLPRKAVFAFLIQEIYDYVDKNACEQVAVFQSATKLYPVYVTCYKGEAVCLCQAPVGAAPATQILDWLIGYGVREIISTGCCGTLVDLPENTFIVPTRALRDEGTSYHYMAPSRYVAIDRRAVSGIEKALRDKGLQYTEVTTWSTDGFYRETQEKVLYRKEEGCSIVEMECAALAACAKLRGAIWGQLLFTADTLVDVEAHDCRGWGRDSHTQALMLCLEAVLNIEGAV